MLIHYVKTANDGVVTGWSVAKFPDDMTQEFKQQYLTANNATEISQEQYATLLAQKKFQLVDGQLTEVIPPIDLDQLKDDASRLIDNQAEQTRLKFVTPGAAQAGVYNLKYQEAKNFLTTYNAITAASANPSEWLFLSADAAAYAGTLYQAAQIIHETGTAWIAFAASIEQLRLTAKRAVSLAVTKDQIDTALAIDWPSP